MDSKLRDAIEQIQAIEAAGGVAQVRVNAESDWYDWAGVSLQHYWEIRAKPPARIPFDLERAKAGDPVVNGRGDVIPVIVATTNPLPIISVQCDRFVMHHATGEDYADRSENNVTNLFMAAPAASKREPHTMYANIYDNGRGFEGSLYCTQERAKDAASRNAIAVAAAFREVIE